MKVVLSTLGRFHTFDLARQLHRAGALQAIYSGYPRFKLKGEQLPGGTVRTFPFVHAPYMAFPWRDRIGTKALRAWEYADRVSLDRYVAATLPECNVFVGLSGSGLVTGLEAKRRGAKYVCDRGSTHIRHHDEVLRAEHRRFGLPFSGIDPRIVAREEAEYAAADLITVPSNRVRDTFTARGVAPAKVAVLPYGVDLQRFQPAGSPAADRLDLLFVGGLSLRKGAPYLLQAFQAIHHPRKTLTIAGIAEAATLQRVGELGLVGPEVNVVGHVPQTELKRLMSRSHALVLPSVEEGLAMVMAQALACGCPVVATRGTGAENLFSDGREGFIVDDRDVDALRTRLQALADDPALRLRCSEAALARVGSIGGWGAYGDGALRLYRTLLAPTTPAPRR